MDLSLRFTTHGLFLYKSRVCVANDETSVFRFGLGLTIHDALGIHIRNRACVANEETLDLDLDLGLRFTTHGVFI